MTHKKAGIKKRAKAEASTRLMTFKKENNRLALTSFKARILFIDDIYTTLAANHAVVTVTLGKSFQRILDFHCSKPRPYYTKQKARLRRAKFERKLRFLPPLVNQ
jgi:hypothetical protein